MANRNHPPSPAIEPVEDRVGAIRPEPPAEATPQEIAEAEIVAPETSGEETSAAPEPDAVPSAEPAAEPEVESQAASGAAPGAEPETGPEAEKPAPLLPEKELSAAAPAAQERKSRSGGFFLPLIGGALAAAGGFAVSHYNLLQLRQEPDLAAIEERLARLDANLATVTATAEDASAASAQVTALADEALRLARDAQPGQDHGVEIIALSEQFQALQERIESLGAAAGEGSPAALLALEEKVSALQAALETRPEAADPEVVSALIRQEIDARTAALMQEAEERAAALAQETQVKALREAAKVNLREAIQTGAPFAAALATLAPEGAPPDLAAFAETGLPTLTELRDSFPEAARTALSRSLRENSGETMGDRFWTFLRIKLGMRSLTPQDGGDPDAVLSRAEAALAAGDLATALQELTALPPAGQGAMADWVTRATARLNAEAAIAALVDAP